ncbi:protoporphyrinogen oxidase [Rapidithrix thailandica]|uniref:Coproporphyrinogen III oxidase n=1 Tax=Rapidithrix thailandica TaxID=413964 RepID=A0AAW9S6F1_9BACT
MIGIIGGGISGLATAYYLQKKGVPYTLLELSSRAGGVIASKKDQGHLLELGPNSLLCNQNTLTLLRELDLDRETITPEEVSKHRYIFKNGAYQALPSSPPALLSNNFFSFSTKMKILFEFFHRSKGQAGETVADFFQRHFGKEVVENAVNPFISGIYAGDPAQLLMEKTFPSLLAFEAKYGSVLKGFIKNAKTTERKVAVSFTEGMQTLPYKLASVLEHIEYNCKVSRIEANEGGFRVSTEKGSFAFDQIVLSLPARATANILNELHPDFAESLMQLHYPPMAVVHSVFERDAVGHPLNGFGGLNPKTSGLFLAGSIWSSSLFRNRTADDKVLITSFVGGVQYEKNAQLGEDEIRANVTRELQNCYQISAAPIYQHFTFWPKAIPQYDQRILPVETKLPQLAKQGIHVCANWYGGVSIADCIDKGATLANTLSPQIHPHEV